MKRLWVILFVVFFGCTSIYRNSSCDDEKLIRISKVAKFAKKNNKQPYDILSEEENAYYIANIQNCPKLYDHYAKLRKREAKLAKQKEQRRREENNASYGIGSGLSNEDTENILTVLLPYFNNLSSTSFRSEQPKGCNVFGKIKFVEFGEDYKVKFVSFGENLKVKYVSFGEKKVGNWKTVDFGQDYKIKVVDFGEDFSVKRVDFGQGCN